MPRVSEEERVILEGIMMSSGNVFLPYEFEDKIY